MAGDQVAIAYVVELSGPPGTRRRGRWRVGGDNPGLGSQGDGNEAASLSVVSLVARWFVDDVL